MKQLDASPVSTASGSVDFDAHNIWNPMMELLFHMQIGGKLRSLRGGNGLGKNRAFLSFCS